MSVMYKVLLLLFEILLLVLSNIMKLETRTSRIINLFDQHRQAQNKMYF